MMNRTRSAHQIRPILFILFVLAAFSQGLAADAEAQTSLKTSPGTMSHLAASRANALRVSFTYSPKYPTVGQVVQFTETSTGSPTSWQWNFGDGTTSTTRNPTHVYAASGFRKVTLVVSNRAGSKTLTKTVTVLASQTPASFTFSPTTPAPGQAVQFTDTTPGSPTSWRWSFGDGTTSTSQHPSHAYATAGSYTVALTAANSSWSRTGSRTITVAAMSVLSSSFTFSPTSPVVGQAVQFTDTSTGSPASWSWSFGDGTTSTSRNPSHIYAAAGSYSVSLTVANGSSTNTAFRTVTVRTNLAASFSFSPTSPVVGEAVQFTDTSTGSPTSWSWSFGDGTASTSQNPSHTYATAGPVTVTLTVANSSGSSTTAATLIVASTITAGFSFSPPSPVIGEAVQFTDMSTGGPTSWNWSFGDGTTSTSQHPSHTYMTAGSYSVALTVVNASGQDDVTRIVIVAAESGLAASFTYSPSSPAAEQTVQFTDTSTGNPSSWNWDFGDGSTSTLTNPSHAYKAAGSFPVTLSVSNGSESDSLTKTLVVSSSDGDIHYAASPGLTDVQAALSIADPGDTVIIPEGSASWGSTLAITKGIKLMASSYGGTTIRASAGHSGTYLLTYTVTNAAADDPFRLSGFVLDSGGVCGGISIICTAMTPQTKIRIDHCTFQNYPKSNTDVIWMDGPLYGVLDSCTFNIPDGSNTNLRLIRPYGRSAGDGGQKAWTQRSFEFGTADNFYIEDCIFRAGTMVCTNGGAGRYCFRHNSFDFSTTPHWTIYFLDVHGNNSGGPGNWSGFGAEVYENTIQLPSTAGGINFMNLRGGKCLIYNNYVTRAGGGSVTLEAEAYEESLDSTSPPANNLINGQPQHPSDYYVWNNYGNGVKTISSRLPWVAGALHYSDLGRTVPLEDHDYWREKTDFNGTTGMGSGLLSARPASCTIEGAAYWATDTNTLYRWHNGAWESYYKPYPYPHPLRSK